MNNLFIKVNSLSKYFYKSKSNTSINAISVIFRLIIKRSPKKKDLKYALKEISFNLNKGEAIGIIGNTGAGKSTLLKIISKKYKPSNGSIERFTDIASLRDLIILYDKTLSVRQNILNFFVKNSIFVENQNKLLEKISEHAGLKNYLDVPLIDCFTDSIQKLTISLLLYSHGGVIIIDDYNLILRKFLKTGKLKIEDASIIDQFFINAIKLFIKQGKSAFIVSNDIKLIKDICQKTLWLDRGRIKKFGNSNDVCSTFIKEKNKINPSEINHRKIKPHTISNSITLSTSKSLFQKNIDYLMCKESYLYLRAIDSLEVFNKVIHLVCYLGNKKDTLVFRKLLIINSKNKSKNLNLQIKLPANYFNKSVYEFRVLFLSKLNNDYQLFAQTNSVFINFYDNQNNESSVADNIITKEVLIAPLLEWKISKE